MRVQPGHGLRDEDLATQRLDRQVDAHHGTQSLDQAPAAQMTVSVAMVPWSVTTRVMAPPLDSMR